MATIPAVSVDTSHAASSTELAPSLGALLHNFRTEVGESVKAVSRRCSLGTVEIAQLELGRADLSTEELADAIGAYAVPRFVFPESRSRVRVDLVGGSVSVRIADSDIAETSADCTLLGYFELIFAAGKMAPDTAIPFTALDLAVLRVLLSSRRDDVTRHLEILVGPPESTAVLPGRLRQRALLALTAVLAFGGTAFAISSLVSSSQTPAVPIPTQIIDAVVITRADTGRPVSGGPAQSSSNSELGVANPGGKPIELSKDAK
jgi:hypothetical protein